jgi:biopolymer transport protein ExbD
MNPRRTKQRIVSEINITPFTDVILVLLIIFMVTTPILLQSGIKVELPRAATKQTIQKKITVTITSDGQVFLNNQKYNLSEQTEAFKKELAKAAAGESSLVIDGDRNVKYDAVVQVLDVASQAGIRRIALAVELKEK